jgi:hypothetical protein
MHSETVQCGAVRPCLDRDIWTCNSTFKLPSWSCILLDLPFLTKTSVNIVCLLLVAMDSMDKGALLERHSSSSQQVSLFCFDLVDELCCVPVWVPYIWFSLKNYISLQLLLFFLLWNAEYRRIYRRWICLHPWESSLQERYRELEGLLLNHRSVQCNASL